MQEVAERIRIAEDPDQLWHQIGKFASVGEWHPMLIRVESDGEHEGASRTAIAKDGSRQTERLIERAPRQRLYRYRMESTPMPVRNYIGEFRIDDNPDRTSTVVWRADFDVSPDNERAAVETVRAFLKSGLEELKSLHSPALG
jgi:Polyketide cyclase / dehydrase and lipid transport